MISSCVKYKHKKEKEIIIKITRYVRCKLFFFFFFAEINMSYFKISLEIEVYFTS